jgi:putative mRNA 3-end processing factor
VKALLETNENGLFCPEGNFYIDPVRGVDLAVITHAHSDHARGGSRNYLCASPGAPLLRERLGASARVQPAAYGEEIAMNGVRVSLHPAGHVLGSAQVRLEVGGEVWVVSGDYKTCPDPTCAEFEPLRCDLFVTESTFALPIYQWPRAEEVMEEIRAWWAGNQAEGRTSVVFAYSLGKAQRLLAELRDPPGAVFAHPAICRITEIYREAGVVLPPVRPLRESAGLRELAGALVLGPPAWGGAQWTAKPASAAAACASGWMQTRKARAGQRLDRGFVLSDHADWPGLNRVIRETGAARVWVTHGFTAVLARWLNESGLEAMEMRKPDAAQEKPPTE